MAVVVPVVVSRRMKRAPADDDEEEASDAVAEAPPVKIGISITAADKPATVRVPPNMPLARLIQNCVDKLPLPHANFAAHVNGEAVDSGLVDGAEIQLVSLEE